ncbi:MAG TPA: hypothetical protein P5509_04825 [Bacteroidales bacterium]|nr:hypothetical protein [Bacteroidales bacterium]
MANKSYTFSLDENLHNEFKTIVDLCGLNKSAYMQKMVQTFVDSVKNGKFDAIFEMADGELLSDKIKNCNDRL